MPLQATAGAATYDAFGGGPAVAAKYIEDYFQTWLRTGTGASATVTTGINASLNKSLVWTKSRSAATDHKLTDTVRGATKGLISNTTGAETTDTNGLTAFSSTGYTIGTDTDYNTNGATYVDWQWAATPKFFDVVTYTGDGTANKVINHSLGAVPGAIIIKRTDAATNWTFCHRSFTNGLESALNLNSTSGDQASSGVYGVTSTSFTVSDSTSSAGSTTINSNNASGGTYVAYIFAHNAGGFGLTGTDNVISCGSFTTDASGNATVSLGYEPQWCMFKRAVGGTGNWTILDNMRGWVVGGNDNQLQANSSGAETSASNLSDPNATGFSVAGISASSTYIYIAIRRGPMRTPTSGTSVFAPSARSGTGAAGSSTALGNVTDLAIIKQRGSTQTWAWTDRLRGATNELTSAATTAETAYSNDVTGFDSMTGFLFGSGASGQVNSSGSTYGDLLFRRAPGFFDVVCYTGTGSATTFSHNLGVVPEMMIVKRRDTTVDWWVYDVATGNTKYQVLNSTATPTTSSTAWNNTTPTSSVFTVGTGTPVNASAGTYVAYLFATVAGVSKVFSYTGNGSSQTINCGFTAGTRFVLIKRTDSTGDWYVWDSARGIVASNDPHLSLNTTAAEVTTDDSVDTDNTGFVVNQVAATNVNVSSATYIGLAIA